MGIYCKCLNLAKISSFDLWFIKHVKGNVHFITKLCETRDEGFFGTSLALQCVISLSIEHFAFKICINTKIHYR